MVSDWGIHLSKHLQVLATSFPDHFPPIMWQTWREIASTVDFPSD